MAIDERRGDVAEAQWHILDVRDPAIAEKLRGADVVVHLALDLDLETDAAARTAYNVRGTQTVLTAAAAAGVHRVVLCTSAMVYGALPDNDIPLSEDAELRATAEATGVGDLLEIERLGRRAPRAHPGLNVTVVRPAVLVGGTDTALTRYFESPRLLVVAGTRPTWQFCHVEDLVSALEYAALEKVDGEFAVGCDGWLEQEEVEELSGIRRMELPSAVALGAAARLHRIGLTPSPAGDLAYTMHPWVVSVSRLHDAGWRPRWTNEEVLAELLEEVAGPAHRRRPPARPQGRHGRGRGGRDGGPARYGGAGAPGPQGAGAASDGGPAGLRPTRSAVLQRGACRTLQGHAPLPVETALTCCRPRTAPWTAWHSPTTTPASRRHRTPSGCWRSATPRSPSTRSSAPSGDDAAGGTALFVGTVRNHDGGADVDALGYSCHPSAEAETAPGRREGRRGLPGAGAGRRPPGGRSRGGRPRGGRRGVLPAPRRGVRGVPEADRRPQARGADLEAPDVLGRHGGVGRHLTPPRAGPPLPGDAFRHVIDLRNRTPAASVGSADD